MKEELPEQQSEQESREEYSLYDAMDALAPQDFLALYRIAAEREYINPDASSELIEFEDSHDDLALIIQMHNYLETISTRDVQRARDVLTFFAGSPLAKDRWHVVRYGRSLAQVDHDSGLDLWCQFLRDPDAEVRAKAFDLLDDSVEDPELTPADILRLTNAYYEAERGENLHDPVRHAGELALRRLVSLMEPENES
ncbi:hypothetical protein [Streptomyces sp. UG1]|uniref:hypothetical protein n=1 Tax=Streptomyces sp. UG1 TaxID=3417652 RepID=UPI003CE7092C